MKEQQEMTTEQEDVQEKPAPLPAAMLLATEAPTAEVAPEPEWEEEEQEDPYAGRSLPEEAETQEEEVPPELAPPAPAEQDDELAFEPEEDEEEDAAAPAEPRGTQPPAEEATALPQEGAEQGARRQYWERVLTGFADTVPDAVRRRAGADDAGLTEEQNEYRLLGTINRSWAVDHLGMDRERVQADWGRLRRELAERFHVADDEQELFAAISVAAQDAPRRQQEQALMEQHYRAALLGNDLPLPLAEGKGEELREYYLAAEAQRRGQLARAYYQPLVADVTKALNVFAGMEEELFPAPRVLGASPEFVRAVDSLADLSEQGRRVVYNMAQAEYLAEHPQQDKSFYRTLRRASARGAAGLGMGAGQALANAAVATMDSLGNVLGGEAGQSLHEGAEALDLRARIAEEMRQLYYGEVKPLSHDGGLTGQLLVDAAGATPAAVAACSGGAGFAALGLSGMGEAVAAARQRAPEGSQWLQYLAGIVGGGIQAAIYSGMSRVGGQMLSNAINRFARASGTGAGGYAFASLGVLASMGLEEAKLLFAAKAADAVGLGAQELAARLDKTASNIDWKSYGENAQDVELNLREAAMTLPFILIGSGRVALRHFRSRDAVLGDGYALQRWGIDEAMSDAIMKEGNINRQGDMLREALRGSRRWSAPGFMMEALRALRLLNTDYYQGFKNAQAVVDFLKLPSQSTLAPRPPIEALSPENPEHAAKLLERHGVPDKVNRKRLWLAFQLRDEWIEKAHLVGKQEGDEQMLSTAERRRRYGEDILREDGVVPRSLYPGSSSSTEMEKKRMAVFRDRVAELHDLSYQLLLSSFPLDALSHSTRGIDHLRQSCEAARRSMLEAVARCVLRRVTGVSEEAALDELGLSVSNYFRCRRYSPYPPGWMTQVPVNWTRRLDDYARMTYTDALEAAPAELRDAFRVALGLRSCASALYEVLPCIPDFHTALTRGLTPAKTYVHLLSRELELPLSELPEVQAMLNTLGRRQTDMRLFRVNNEADFALYNNLTGYVLERALAADGKRELSRARRPNGSYTHWHLREADVINDVVGLAALAFLPYSEDWSAPLRVLDAGKPYDLNKVGRADTPEFTHYDNLCRVALRDTARSWMEYAPNALPGFVLGTLRRYVYFGGSRYSPDVLTQPQESAQSMLVDRYTLSSPLRLAQARFRTYWWRQLNGGLLDAPQVGEELVKLRIISEDELARVKDIAKPLLMPRDKDVPLKDTPPPNIAGMNRAMAEHLTTFSMRYFLAHLDDMPLPSSAREWFRLAPFCPLLPEPAPEKTVRISLRHDGERLTRLHNREAVRELKEGAPAVAELRRAEREGLLVGSPLLAGLRRAVGLNRSLNLEQAWCMQNSGADSMMSGTAAYWHLMEHPLEGWEAMPPAEQKSLRAHIDTVCRAEVSSATMEAEARGEKPDYVVEALRNLQEVLADYPRLRQYGLEMVGGKPMVRRLLLETVPPGNASAWESEGEAGAFYTAGRSMQPGYSLGELKGLPGFLRADTRALPALHLLTRLRGYPGSRPFVSREGIQWHGKLYGGAWGKRLRGLSSIWMPEKPLRGMMELFKLIKEQQAELPPGERLNMLVPALPVLEEVVPLDAFRHVTLYRPLDAPARLCRLMPGEEDAANPIAGKPHVVQSVAGVHLGNSLALRRAEDMHRAYTPLELFRPHRSRMGSENVRKRYYKHSLGYTLACMLSPERCRAELANPQGGISSLSELLLRFAEDTGFSRSLFGRQPQELSAGQIIALELSRELLLSICGSEPQAAYERFVQLGKRIRDNADELEALQRALINSAEDVYRMGEPLFAEKEGRQPAPAKPARKTYGMAPRLSREEREQLDEWSRDNQDQELDAFNPFLYSGGNHDD